MYPAVYKLSVGQTIPNSLKILSRDSFPIPNYPG